MTVTEADRRPKTKEESLGLHEIVCAASPSTTKPRRGPAAPRNSRFDDLDAKTLALVRIAALVADGGAVPSYGELADAAVDAGASAAEIVEVLVAVVPIVGLPCVVAAAPKLAMALGYDIDERSAPDAGPAGEAANRRADPIDVACSTASPREDTPSFR